MRIAICDDEKEYIEDAERHIKQYFAERGLSFELFAFETSEEILRSSKNFNIAILDIEMDGVNGIEIGKELQKVNPETVLIYITAYDHYLDDALDLGIMRFFDKPINSERFYSGLDKAIAKVDNSKISFFIKDDKNGMCSVLYKDIIYVEIFDRKTKLVTKNREFLSTNSMTFWKEHLTKSYFEIPHHSFIINTNYVTYYNRDFLVLNGKENIPIAYSKRKLFKDKFVVKKGD